MDKNPVFCTICFKKINWGPQQDMAPTCFDKNCNARCHQGWDGLSIRETHRTKNSGNSITLKCPQHGTGIAEIIIPPTPVYEPPNFLSAVGKSCSVCKNPIPTHYADLAYNCANPSCGNVCHLAVTFSGFVKPRRNTRAFTLFTRVWHWHLRSSSSPTSHPSLSPDNSPPRPNHITSWPPI